MAESNFTQFDRFKAQMALLVPLLRRLRAELGEATADALVAEVLDAEARAHGERLAAAGLTAGASAGPVEDLRLQLRPLASRFFDELRSGRLNGHLEASTAVRLAAQFRYATGDLPLESYQLEFGPVGTPAWYSWR